MPIPRLVRGAAIPTVCSWRTRARYAPRPGRQERLRWTHSCGATTGSPKLSMSRFAQVKIATLWIRSSTSRSFNLFLIQRLQISQRNLFGRYRQARADCSGRGGAAAAQHSRTYGAHGRLARTTGRSAKGHPAICLAFAGAGSGREGVGILPSECLRYWRGRWDCVRRNPKEV